MTTLNGIIYVAAGYDGVSVLQSCERYDPLTGNYFILQMMHFRLTALFNTNHLQQKVSGAAARLYPKEEGTVNLQLWTTVFGL